MRSGTVITTVDMHSTFLLRALWGDVVSRKRVLGVDLNVDGGMGQV
jgi:hypothetical protein